MNEHVGVDIPEDDFETIGGFVISLLGYLPQDGEMNEVDYKNLHFTVLNIEERRIGKLKVEINPIQTEEETKEGNEQATKRERSS